MIATIIGSLLGAVVGGVGGAMIGGSDFTQRHPVLGFLAMLLYLAVLCVLVLAGYTIFHT